MAEITKTTQVTGFTVKDGKAEIETRTVTTPICAICGEPMPQGEEMFMYHGYSGSCPKPRKEKLPLVTGSGRDVGNDKAVIIYCVRPPTDDELRAIHDAAREATLV